MYLFRSQLFWYLKKPRYCSLGQEALCLQKRVQAIYCSDFLVAMMKAIHTVSTLLKKNSQVLVNLYNPQLTNHIVSCSLHKAHSGWYFPFPKMVKGTGRISSSTSIALKYPTTWTCECDTLRTASHTVFYLAPRSQFKAWALINFPTCLTEQGGKTHLGLMHFLLLLAKCAGC